MTKQRGLMLKTSGRRMWGGREEQTDASQRPSGLDRAGSRGGPGGKR